MYLASGASAAAEFGSAKKTCGCIGGLGFGAAGAGAGAVLSKNCLHLLLSGTVAAYTTRPTRAL
jgi:hypothetical protein